MNRRDSNTRPNYTEVQLAFLGRPCRLGRYSTVFVPYNLSRVQRTSPKAEIVQGTLVSGDPFNPSLTNRVGEITGARFHDNLESNSPIYLTTSRKPVFGVR